MTRRKLGLKLLMLAATTWCAGTATAQDSKGPVPDRQKRAVFEQLPKTQVGTGVKLLPGYQQTREALLKGIIGGKISKEGGLEIAYVMGSNLGPLPKPTAKNMYLKYWERVVNGRIARFAYATGNIFMISVPLDDKPDTTNSANFATRVQEPDEAGDMIVMALSLIPG